MDLAALKQTIDQATAALSSISNDIDEHTRTELHKSCQKLSASLETPDERLLRNCSGYIEATMIKLVLDTGIVGVFNEQLPGDEEVDAREIAQRTGLDYALTGRILRYLVALGVVEVTAQGRCRALPVAKSLVPGTVVHDTVLIVSGLYVPLFAHLPSYLRQNNYHVSENGYNGLFQHTMKTDLHFFDWLQAHKPEHDAFHRMMEGSASSKDKSAWTDYIGREWFDCHLPSAGGKDFMFVDVGGSYGHELQAFMRRFPHLRGRFILQDLAVEKNGSQAEVVGDDADVKGSKCDGEHCRQPRPIEKMAHNFFDPQPILGADIYLLARILHDWPDEQAKVILRRIREAMSGSSTLFIFDRVFSDGMEKVSHIDAVYDALMLALFSSLERSESLFAGLLAEVGLRLVRVWRVSEGIADSQAVLEVVRDGVLQRKAN
ncbi:S-adenosyl-L-methionine-dependent methyltransferase [Aspergillus pseudoustus]|uniref:S-adenosyl-L-methionine-dependent methyltransferase n=1 Tax=Aspergillus pseudoustus TaxID=1810923 RepID=A0ABR4KEG9_9EURO